MSTPCSSHVTCIQNIEKLIFSPAPPVIDLGCSLISKAYLPELGANLVAALPTLDVHNFTHLGIPPSTILCNCRVLLVQRRQVVSRLAALLQNKEDIRMRRSSSHNY